MGLIITWHKMPDYPIGIEDPAICMYGDNIISIAGFTAGCSNKFPNLRKNKINKYKRGFKKDCFIFNVVEGKWRRLPHYPGEGKQQLKAVNIDDCIYVYGGFRYDIHQDLKHIPKDRWPNKNGYKVYDNGYMLSKQTGEFRWTSLPNMSYSATNHLLLNHKNYIYSILGATIFDHTKNAQPLVEYNNKFNGNFIYRTDVNDLNRGWEKVSEFPGSLRMSANGCIYNDELFIIGGYHPNPSWNYRNNEQRYYYAIDNWKCNLTTKKWTRISDNPYPIFHIPGSPSSIYKNCLIMLSGAVPIWTMSSQIKFIDNGKLIPYDDDKKFDYDSVKDQRSIVTYNLDNDCFELSKSKLPVSASNISYLIHKDMIYCCGGESSKESSYEGSYYGLHLDLFIKGSINL